MTFNFVYIDYHFDQSLIHKGNMHKVPFLHALHQLFYHYLTIKLVYPRLETPKSVFEKTTIGIPFWTSRIHSVIRPARNEYSLMLVQIFFTCTEISTKNALEWRDSRCFFRSFLSPALYSQILHLKG